jgi:hypothetical protein
MYNSQLVSLYVAESPAVVHNNVVACLCFFCYNMSKARHALQETTYGRRALCAQQDLHCGDFSRHFMSKPESSRFLLMKLLST